MTLGTYFSKIRQEIKCLIWEKLHHHHFIHYAIESYLHVFYLQDCVSLVMIDMQSVSLNISAFVEIRWKSRVVLDTSTSK